MTKQPPSPPRPLILICALLVVPPTLETALLYLGVARSVTPPQALWALLFFAPLCAGLLARIRAARLAAIFTLAAFAVVSLIILTLPILQMFSLRYFTLEAALLNTASLLYVGGMFAAAIWLNGKEGSSWFGVTRAKPKSPNKSLNTDAGKAGAG